VIFNRTSYRTAFALHPRYSLGGLSCSTGSNCPGMEVNRIERRTHRFR
jgi:hypothetical protein